MKRSQKRTISRIMSLAMALVLLYTAYPVPVSALGYETATLTLLNHDGSETLYTDAVDAESVFTQAELSGLIEAEEAIRPGYAFVGWSADMGEVSASYVPAASFTISEDTVLYAVHRPLTAKDIDMSAGSELLASLEEFDSALSEVGFSVNSLPDQPARDDEFYAWLEEYTDSLQDALSEKGAAQAPARAAAPRASSTVGTQRLEHAYNDAVWSVARRSDLNFATEFVYMYTSHYIDVAEPFGGTNINHDEQYFQLYITDLDRRTYATFYQSGSYLDLYTSMLSFISALHDTPGAFNGVSSALLKNGHSITDLVSVANAITTGAGDWQFTNNLTKTIINDAYLEICTMEYASKEELFAQMDALTQRVSERLGDIEIDTLTVAQCIVGVTSCLVTGGGVIAAVTPFMGFYSQFFKSLMDRVYFVIMRNYIQTRVGERMMYAWGMSNGRN